jgi:hypothetical protein
MKYYNAPDYDPIKKLEELITNTNNNTHNINTLVTSANNNQNAVALLNQQVLNLTNIIQVLDKRISMLETSRLREIENASTSRNIEVR